MTDVEWRVATDPTPMLRSLPGNAGSSDICFFVCACCDRIRRLMQDPRSVRAVELLRGAARGGASREEIEHSIREADIAVSQAVRAVCVPILGEQEFAREIRMMRSGPDPFEMMAAHDPAYNAAQAAAFAVRCLTDRSHAEIASRFAAEAVARSSDDVPGTRTRERAAQADLLRESIET
jgi:hypothetical protein